MIIAGAKVLDDNKKTVDALNVFPVPDGDTGTNMSMTFNSAVKELNSCLENKFSAIADAVSKGALRGARGNSGVILSQILKGMCSVIAQSENEFTTKIFAKALAEGATIAYKAVTKPKEGTILTVIRVMAEAATHISKRVSDFEVFFGELLKEGENILQQTPEMLPVLKKAGVVDAGGQGLLLIFTGMHKVILGDEDLDVNIEDLVITPIKDNEFFANLENLADIEFAYCTEFMILNMKKKTTVSDIDKLREKLLELGDCVVCIGDLQLVKVHVHTNQPNIALGNALELGEIVSVKVENMLEQNRELKRQQTKGQEDLKEFGIIAVAPGDGIANVFKDIQVDSVIEGGQTMNPSAEDIAKAVDKVNAKNVFVFPNNKNIILACEQARGLTKKFIHVIPSKSVPEGLSGVLAFNPEGSLEENLEAMNSSMANVKSGSVTHAVRTTHVDGFDVEKDDIIGLDNGAILAKGNLVNNTTMDLIRKLKTDEIVSVTLFYGKEVNETEAKELESDVVKEFPDSDVSLIYGGQPVYYYILSLE